MINFRGDGLFGIQPQQTFDSIQVWSLDTMHMPSLCDVDHALTKLKTSMLGAPLLSRLKKKILSSSLASNNNTDT